MIPRRFKLLELVRHTTLNLNLYNLDFLEKDTHYDLEGKAVDPNLWEYYVGFNKRVWEIRGRFNDATFQLEKASLRQEYIDRGLDPAILDQIQAIAEWHAENPGQDYPFPFFYSGFEPGNFSEWTGTGGTGLSVQSVVVHTGTYSARRTGTLFHGWCYKDLYQTALHHRVEGYVRYDTLNFFPGFPWHISTLGFMDGLREVAGFGIYWDQVTRYLALIHRTPPTWFVAYTFGEACQLGKWYKVAVEMYRHATEGWIKLYIDDVLKKEVSGLDTRDVSTFRCFWGNRCDPQGGGMINVYGDEVNAAYYRE